jgi:hypothetical protein
MVFFFLLALEGMAVGDGDVHDAPHGIASPDVAELLQIILGAG